MIMKNSKGIVYAAVAAIQIAMAGAVGAAIWHVPAWSQAKATHTEAAYQSQKMWPQELFAKLPGGDNYKK